MSNVYKLPRNEDGKIWFSRKYAALEPGPKDGLFTLLEEFWVSWEHDGIVYRLRAPKGMVTDIASVPRVVWSLSGITPDGFHRNAAVIHDPTYGWQGKFPPNWFQYKDEYGQWQNCHKYWTRDAADRMFLRILKASGVSKFRRYKMYWALKVAGWWAWRGKDTAFQQQYRDAFSMASKQPYEDRYAKT